MARKTYTEECKSHLVSLVKSGRTAGSLAKEFEPTATTIHAWVMAADGVVVKKNKKLSDTFKRGSARLEAKEALKKLQRLHRKKKKFDRVAEVVRSMGCSITLSNQLTLESEHLAESIAVLKKNLADLRAVNEVYLGIALSVRKEVMGEHICIAGQQSKTGRRSLMVRQDAKRFSLRLFEDDTVKHHFLEIGKEVAKEAARKWVVGADFQFPSLSSHDCLPQSPAFARL